MILHVLVFILWILFSHSNSNSILLPAPVGNLFELNNSIIHEFESVKLLPYWLCNSSSKYQGIPMMKDQGIILVNDNLTIEVSSESKFQQNLHCTHRWPTVMVFFTDKHFSRLSGCDRLQLWNRMQRYLKGFAAHMKLDENIAGLMKSLSALAQWKTEKRNDRYKIHTAIISHIGCGSIPEEMIENLKYLEKEKNVDQLSKKLSISIREWLVADVVDPIIVRRRRHSKNGYYRYTEYSSIFYRHEKQQEEWNEAKIIIEGSGQFGENWTTSLQEGQTFQSKKPFSTSSSKTLPIIKKALENITAYVGSRRFYQIPPNTFFDAEDGNNRNMKLKIYLSSKNGRSDQQIYYNADDWIYFLKTHQTVILQPRKNNVGQYDLTVCAYDSDMNRICDGVKLLIKKPSPVKKSSHLSAPPGVVWKYPIPYGWSDEVKFATNDSVTIRVQSFSPVEWHQNSSMISLITEAFDYKEHKIQMTAESQTTGKTLIWLIIVTTSGHNTYLDETSAEIVYKISSQSPGKIPFDLINHIKDNLIAIISRYWKILSSTSRDILLYRITQGREAFSSNRTETPVVLSFVYSPKKMQSIPSSSVNCSKVIIVDELLEIFKANSFLFYKKWRIEFHNLLEVPGKCMSQKIPRNTHKLSTTPLSVSLNPKDITIPDLLNKTISFAVYNGLTFKKLIAPLHQPELKLIRNMQLFDNNNLIIEESSWVFLSNSQFTIFGLPLLENVRKEPYLFKLKVTLNSGRIQLVTVNIVVEKFVPIFNHKFGLIISISEKDTLELDRARLQMNGNSLKTMGQLLISQTLSYRWQVVQTIADYLFASQCISDCGTNIFIHSFSEPKNWQVNISWSVVSKSPGAPDYPTVYSVTSCEDIKLKSYIRSLIMPDPNTESIISSISTLQAHPNENLIKSFQSKSLGTPAWVNVESSGSCSSLPTKPDINSSGVLVLWLNLSVHQGSIFAFALETQKYSKKTEYQNAHSSKIFYQNGSVCELEWVKLSQTGRIIYGLPLLSDVEIPSYFALRIVLEFGEAREKLKYHISISLKPSRHFGRETHRVNMTMSVHPSATRNIKALRYRVRVARMINGFLHPSCSLTDKALNTEFQYFTQEMHKKKNLEFCEKAEDIILYSIDSRVYHNETFIDILWGQVSVSVKDSNANPICDVTVLQDLSKSLFQNYSSPNPNQELISFFDNTNIGRLYSVKLQLFDECLDILSKRNIKIQYEKVPSDIYNGRSIQTSRASAKIALVVLFVLFILIVLVVMVIYFIKKGVPSSFTRLTDKTSKSVALEDFNSATKSPVKSPKSSFTKKLKNNTNLDGFGPSPLNNSPKTPLLSQFSKDESKPEKQKEPLFNDEEATGSFIYAARHPQSPEPPDKSVGILKQPATSNVIRNPAMMMGSRLNPYRNIPPPIV